MVIPGHNLGNSQVSVYRTIGPTLVKVGGIITAIEPYVVGKIRWRLLINTSSLPLIYSCINFQGQRQVNISVQ